MLWALLVGLVVGAIAKVLMPGKDPGGWVVTMLLGVVGSMVAYWIGSSMGMYGPDEPVGIFGAILGSMLLLGIYRMFNRRRILA
jgi:uncharacterized membrane protein YeaQ/YmgE (transglycosylase-associated protein family)